MKSSLVTTSIALAFLAACAPKAVDPMAGIALHDPAVARSAPDALPMRPLLIPGLELRTLSNGLPVVVSTNDKVPLVSITVSLRAGEFAADTPGLAQSTFSMLTEGAGDLTSEQISRKLKLLASTLSAGANDDGASVRTSAMKRNLEPTLDILAAVLTAPTFPDDEWSLLQTRYIKAIESARKDPTSIASRVKDIPFYGDAYRGRVAMESHIQSITPEKMRSWYRNNVGPTSAIILVGGDVTADEIVPLLEARLGRWEGGSNALTLPGSAASIEEDVLYFVDKPGAAQSVVQAMRVVGQRTDEDWFPLNLAIDVLGGTFMSRLNMNLREDKGYTYGARCGINTGYGASVLSCSASVQTAVTGPSLDEMRKELDEILADRPITAEELEYMKSTRLNQYPARFETPSAMLAEQDAIWRYDLPEDWPERFLPSVEAVTLDQAQTALKARLKSGGTAWLVVGDKATIGEQVQGFGLPIIELDADGRRLGSKK
jgi:zinc protease